MIRPLNKSIDVSKIDSKLGIIELEDRNEMSVICVTKSFCPANFNLPFCSIDTISVPFCPVDVKYCFINYGVNFPPKCLDVYA